MEKEKTERQFAPQPCKELKMGVLEGLYNFSYALAQDKIKPTKRNLAKIEQLIKCAEAMYSLSTSWFFD